MADIFTDSQEDEVTTDLTLNDLVGEGRKYSDPDQLAKAYANIEGHSKTLERELAELRAQRDALEARQKNQEPPQNRGQEPPEDLDNGNPAPKHSPNSGDVDFRSQIKDEIRALNEEERAKANIEVTAQKMVELYGSPAKANEAVKNRAAELGVSVEWLRDSASRSPSAFYASMGIQLQGGQSRSTPIPGSDVRIDANAATKNFEYFDKIRRENPKLYFTAATQREMMNEARKQGGDFYKR